MSSQASVGNAPGRLWRGLRAPYFIPSAKPMSGKGPFLQRRACLCCKINSGAANHAARWRAMILPHRLSLGDLATRRATCASCLRRFRTRVSPWKFHPNLGVGRHEIRNVLRHGKVHQQGRRCDRNGATLISALFFQSYAHRRHMRFDLGYMTDRKAAQRRGNQTGGKALKQGGSGIALGHMVHTQAAPDRPPFRAIATT